VSKDIDPSKDIQPSKGPESSKGVDPPGQAEPDDRARRVDALRMDGESKVDALRRLLARKAAAVIRSDPEEAAAALEIGLIDRRWLDDPINHPISSSKPTEILEHFLARSVERKPSLLSTVGLGAVQLLAAHRGPDAGELKVVTVAFTDLEGFTAFTDTHGDSAAVALVNEHHRAANPVVRRWRGRIVKHLGDGLLCTFSDANEAIRAALELLDTSPSPLRLRAGIHVGEVMVSRADVVGHVVNVAARVTETAKGNQIVVTAETEEAAGAIPDAEYRKLRSRRLKGISERVALREVVPVPTRSVAQ
jgi:adenylate cyclase